MQSVEMLIVVVAQMLSKTAKGIPLSRQVTILVDDKFTQQNKVLGDLQLEFTLDLNEELPVPLEQLVSSVAAGFFGSLSKYSCGFISCLIDFKMPDGP